MSKGGTQATPGGSMAPIDAGAGPVVVLVHGQPGAGADWVALANLLSGDHRVLAPDRPGWGSDARGAMGIAANAVVLEELLDDAGAGSPVTVVGHSLGGGVALELALKHPERVGALVLVGSVGVGESLSGFDRLLAVPLLGNGILRAGVATLRRALIAATHLSERHPGARVANMVSVLPTVQAAIGTDGRPIVGRSRQSFLVEQRALLAETPELERSLCRIAVPTAVVTGASDHVVPVSAARSLAGRVPGAELVVIAGGHLLPFDQPEKIAEVVRRYSALASGLRDGRRRRETPEA
ncbi:MAG: alpha/beta fold hydrolase [Acidimicrobiales bacterium]